MHIAGCSLVVLLAITMAASCSPMRDRPGLVPYSCDESSPTPSTLTRFVARVLAIERNALHVDFDDFGTDFDAIEVEFSDPPAWRGTRASIYFQGAAVFNGNVLSKDASMEFHSRPPPCLDQPWLYLSALQ